MSAIKDDLRNLKDEAKDKLSDDISELKSSFSKLRSDVMNLLSDGVGVGKSGGGVLRDKASDAVDGVKDHLHDWQERGGESLEALGKKIEDNPVAAALIAVGVGFVVAKMFSHRR